MAPQNQVVRVSAHTALQGLQQLSSTRLYSPCAALLCCKASLLCECFGSTPRLRHGVKLHLWPPALCTSEGVLKAGSLAPAAGSDAGTNRHTGADVCAVSAAHHPVVVRPAEARVANTGSTECAACCTPRTSCLAWVVAREGHVICDSYCCGASQHMHALSHPVMLLSSCCPVLTCLLRNEWLHLGLLVSRQAGECGRCAVGALHC